MTSEMILHLNNLFHGELNRGRRGYYPTPKRTRRGGIDSTLQNSQTLMLRESKN